MLEPVAGAGVVLASTHGLPNDTARLATGGVTADVTGAWSNSGPSVEIVYRSVAAASLPIASRVTWNGRTVAASHAWDRTVPRPGNAIGRPLLDTGMLRLAARGRRVVQIEYAPAGTALPALGDQVTVDIPMPAGARPVIFRVGEE